MQKSLASFWTIPVALKGCLDGGHAEAVEGRKLSFLILLTDRIETSSRTKEIVFLKHCQNFRISKSNLEFLFIASFNIDEAFHGAKYHVPP